MESTVQDLGRVAVLAELERVGWRYDPCDEDEVRAICPFHDDSTPSCMLNVKRGVFNCKACNASGDFVKFLARALRVTRATVEADLAKRYDLKDQDKRIEPSVIEACHSRIWGSPHLLRELYDRGVTDADIRLYRIGERDGRVIIPITNQAGDFVNLRSYLPGAPGRDKFRSERKRGRMRLWPPQQLGFKRVLLCGGEVKAVVAARVLNQHGVGAVTATGGEGNWSHEFLPEFKDKERVWVCLDTDAAGRKAARQRCAQLAAAGCRWVGDVVLPLSEDRYPHGDVNDFVGRENGDLKRLLDETQQWVSPVVIGDEEESPRRVQFSQTVAGENVGRRMEFTGVVAAALEQSFVVPRRVIVECDKAQDLCAICAVFPRQENAFNVAPESQAILEMVHSQKQYLDLAVRTALGIPAKCPSARLTVTEHFNVEDVRVNPSLEITNRDNDRTLQPAVCVASEATLNGTYDFVGRMWPHPRTQKATLVIAKSTATHDALERHQPRELHRLRVFRPNEWTMGSIQSRLDELYSDLEVNVTRVYLRRDIHLFVDMCCHSVLLLPVWGKVIKGWADVLIIGDSSQGKSEVAMRLKDHYKLGEKCECKNMTPAGLLGGLNQVGETWMVSWGMIPTHDKRWLILEEAKGMPTHFIATLTDARSSGQAEITKISKRRTHARTRLTWLSNPRNDRTMSTYNFGVEAIRDLVGAPEDVRRFDAALVVSAADVDQSEINRLVRDPPRVRHVYTSDLCNALLLWGWTRKPADVVVDEDAEELAAVEASKLSTEYTDQIPLIDKGSTREKLVRLSAALAVRTFSTQDGTDDLKLRVRVCHVQYVVDTLRRVYSSRSFGYHYYSEAERATRHLVDPQMIRDRLETLPNPEEARQLLLYSDQMDASDLMDWFGWDRVLAHDLLSLLVRKRAVRRLAGGHRYVKTPEFIGVLKEWEGQLRERPDHLKERF